MRLFTKNMLQQVQISKIAAQITPEIPSKIYLDMTPDCNLFCIMCRKSIENSNRRMPFELFKQIVDETCQGVTSYSLFNSRESLLLTDFKDRVNYLAKHKLPETSIDLSTNGMLLTEGMSRFLIDRKVEVSISFDASYAGLFEKIRRGSDFKVICHNIEKIAAMAAKMDSFQAPAIAISIQKDNWMNLVNIVAAGKELGIKRVSMWPVTGPEECRLIPSEQVLDRIAEAIHLAEDSRMAIHLYPVKLGEFIWNGERYSKAVDSLIDDKCNAPFTCTGITWNGDIYLCCNHGDVVDNIEGKSFQEVWRGEKYRKLRRQVNEKANIPRLCRYCFWVNRY